MCFFFPSKIFHLLHSTSHRQSLGWPTEPLFLLLALIHSAPTLLIFMESFKNAYLVCSLFQAFLPIVSFLGYSSQDTYIVVSPVPSILDSKALFLERSILTSISNGLDHSHINILYPSFLLFFFVMSLFIFFTLLNVFLSPQLE